MVITIVEAFGTMTGGRLRKAVSHADGASEILAANKHPMLAHNSPNRDRKGNKNNTDPKKTDDCNCIEVPKAKLKDDGYTTRQNLLDGIEFYNKLNEFEAKLKHLKRKLRHMKKD